MKTLIFIILCFVNPVLATGWAGLSILIVIADLFGAFDGLYGIKDNGATKPLTHEEQDRLAFEAELDYHCSRAAADEYNW